MNILRFIVFFFVGPFLALGLAAFVLVYALWQWIECLSLIGVNDA